MADCTERIRLDLISDYLITLLGHLKEEEIVVEAKFLHCDTPSKEAIKDKYISMVEKIIDCDNDAIIQVEYLKRLRLKYPHFASSENDKEIYVSTLTLLGTSVLKLYKKHIRDTSELLHDIASTSEFIHNLD